MPNILNRIIVNKALEVGEARRQRSLSELKAAVRDLPPVHSLTASLQAHAGGVIAEFKRRSPSKGWIKQQASVATIVPAYQAAGAAAISVLTDKEFFGGSLSDVVEARRHTELPILRKEFVIDAYQLYEARAVGADACLLIVAAIGAARCRELAALAHDIGLEVLLEVHGEDELEAISSHVDVVGVNNRNLCTFVTDVAQSEALLPLLPAGVTAISESGLLDPLAARRLRKAGYQGFLVGEAFMKHHSPAEALKSYLGVLNSQEEGLC